MKIKKSIFVAVMSLGLVGSLTACNTAASSGSSQNSNTTSNSTSKTVTVGAITALSSSIADLGVPGYNGEALAINDINSSGGLLGKQIKLEKFDAAAKPNLGSQYAQTAILQDHVAALFGPVSSAVAAAIEPVAAQNHTLVFFHTSNDISLTTKGFTKYAFQVVPNTNMESTALALLFKEKGWTKIATISPNYSYGRDTINHFLDTLKKVGVHYTIVNQQWPELGTTDYSSYISTLLASKPQAVFSPLYGGDLVSFAKQGNQFGLFQKTNFVSMLGVTVLQDLGKQAPIGAWGYSRAPFWAFNSSDITNFVNEYKQKYNEYPTSFALMAYTSVQTWAYGVKKAGTFDADKVSDALSGATVPTIRGPITIQSSDHQAQVGEWAGQVAFNSQYPFASWKNTVYFKPEQIMESK
jgi:branched-chain amino acid transport system substrate-binding protein